MKTVIRSLLLSYSPISSDQLVELYCIRAEVTVVVFILKWQEMGNKHCTLLWLLAIAIATYGRRHSM